MKPGHSLSALLAALALGVGIATAQELQTIGTLTMPGVADSPVTVFSAGVSYSVEAPSPSGGGTAGKANFSTFVLTKSVDFTSPLLMVSAASGRVFPQARIDLFDPSGTTVLTTYELANIFVLGAVVRSVQANGARALVEEVALDYQLIRQSVNTPSGPVTACWDRTTNTTC